jgi:glucose-1-phosphate cytidylyltransferase
MKAVILAGGRGLRVSEESSFRPKPLIEIGGMPILWHILKIYSVYGVNEFIICCGYKGYLIKEYFANYFLHMSDVTFNMSNNEMKVHQKHAEPWSVTLVDTGQETMTGGRLLRISKYVNDEEAFCVTYGDGLSNVNIQSSIEFHKSHNKYATMTTTYPPGRFGAVELSGNLVSSFHEKPRGDGGMINGGFFVLSPKIFNYIEGDDSIWEQDPLQKLSNDSQLMAWKHEGFWQPMDTLRDKHSLEDLWETGNAPWKLW